MKANRRILAPERRLAERGEAAVAVAGLPVRPRAPRVLALAGEMPLRAGRTPSGYASLDPWRAADPMTRR